MCFARNQNTSQIQHEFKECLNTNAIVFLFPGLVVAVPLLLYRILGVCLIVLFKKCVNPIRCTGLTVVEPLLDASDSVTASASVDAGDVIQFTGQAHTTQAHTTHICFSLALELSPVHR